jgi:hypothetical protein
MRQQRAATPPVAWLRAAKPPVCYAYAKLGYRTIRWILALTRKNDKIKSVVSSLLQEGWGCHILALTRKNDRIKSGVSSLLQEG